MKLYLTIAIVLLAQTFCAQDLANEPTSKVWSLEECITYAMEHNLTVNNAALNTSISEVEYNRAESAKLPNLFGSASQNFSNGNSIDPITSDFVSDQILSSNIGLSSSMTLFQGNQLTNQIKQKEILLSQSAYIEEIAQNDITVQIVEAYLQALYSKEGIQIAENNLEATEKKVELAKARLDAGEIALSDYTEAQSQMATHTYNVIAQKNNYQMNIINLKQLLELPPTQELALEVIDDTMDMVNLALDKQEVYQQALTTLPEIKSSDLNIVVSEVGLDVAKGAYLPSLSLSGSMGSGYTSINDKSFSDQFNLNLNQRIGLSLSIPIFNRNQTKASVNTAKINIDKAKIVRETTEKAVYKKVETAYQNALSTQEQVIAASASREAAQQSYELAQLRYELGDLSTSELVLSQNTYTNAQQNFLQAKYLNILYYHLLQLYQGEDIKQ